MLVLRPWRAQDVPAVQHLLVDGLRERWSGYDPMRNADTEALCPGDPGRLTLVALREQQAVGTGALRWLGDSEAELVRMSVLASLRRQGIARHPRCTA